ncbi:MAG: fibronectin type III domain-containing protein [Candidatus Binatia bacterium]|nr:fibronectin type III domain-containing protein [Candidatus Binatia bacterium]
MREPKIYVALGFHANFYHSWRGDTPDEAGFGTDIRVVRGILDILDAANAAGRDARGYWEFDNLFTLESILPAHAPDIIERVRRRVAAGRDEVILAPYNNGMFSAMTARELRATLEWAVRNPWGSGVADLFPTYTPVLRPQEYMFTTGTIPYLQEHGIAAMVLAYSNYPFTAFSNFVPALPPDQRFNPLWLKTEAEGPRIVLLPAVSLGDIVNFGSFERWLLHLRRWQLAQSDPVDLLLHINFDADAETWLPMRLPRFLRWLPNTGGLEEYITAVNRYDWAEFTTLKEYLQHHQPRGTVLVRQDMADGAWDGQYSWAEKFPSQWLWTRLEQSRLAEQRALVLAESLEEESRARVHGLLFTGRYSAFFERIRALSTTHFGMSTPLVNEERQEVAERTVRLALEQASAAERLAAERVHSRHSSLAACDYELLVADLRDPGDRTATSFVRVPIWWPAPVRDVQVTTANGQSLPAAVVPLQELDAPPKSAELWFLLPLVGREQQRVCVRLQGPFAHAAQPAPEKPGAAGIDTPNASVSAKWDAAGRLVALATDDFDVAGQNWVRPFVTYRVGNEPRTFEASWRSAEGDLLASSGPVERRRSVATIALPAEDNNNTVKIEIAWTLFANAPGVIADVHVAYPYTPKRDVLHTLQQKLRRYIDLRWVEVAPFPIEPNLRGTHRRPLRVWKHNWLGITSSYDLNYADVNPRNASWDSFNHQVTAGWVAITDGERGLLLAQCADTWSSPAFAPMRLREIDGQQRIWVNPFGSYHGRQMDYSHLGGSGIANEIAERKGAQFRPNGPSFNGQSHRFRLLLAPYRGDAPPAELQRSARSFFYPPTVVYLRSPAGSDVVLPRDLLAWIREQRGSSPPAAVAPGVPRAVLVNPTAGAAHVVWDPPSTGATSYDIAWRRKGGEDWQQQRLQSTRATIANLIDGTEYEFRVRAVGAGDEVGEWTPPHVCRIGAVGEIGFGEEARGLKRTLLLRVFAHSIWAALTTWWERLTLH